MHLFFLMLSFFIQIDETDSLVKKLQNKFEEIKTLSSNFQQKADNNNFISGKFYFSKENNYRIELPNHIIVSDGESIKNKDVSRKRIIISKLDDDPLSFSLREYIFEYPEKCKVTENISGSDKTIILNPKNNSLNFKSVKISVDDEYLISKILVTDWSGATFSLKFYNVNVNSNLSSNLFQMPEDKSCKTIDLR